MPKSEIQIFCAKFFSVAQQIPNILLHHHTKEEFHAPSQIRENPTYWIFMNLKKCFFEYRFYRHLRHRSNGNSFPKYKIKHLKQQFHVENEKNSWKICLAKFIIIFYKAQAPRRELAADIRACTQCIKSRSSHAAWYCLQILIAKHECEMLCIPKFVW